MNKYLEPLLNIQNRVVEIEGDKFWLTIPQVELLYDIQEQYFDPEKAAEAQFPEIAFTTFGQKNIDIITMPTYDTDIVCRLDMERQKQICGRNNEDIYSYRPMLIPLTNELLPDPSFEKQNEAGILLRGGFLVSTPKELPRVAHGGEEKAYPSLHHITKECLSVTMETEEPDKCILWYGQSGPLTWVHIHGCLICTKPVAVIDFPIMYQYRLIPTVPN